VPRGAVNGRVTAGRQDTPAAGELAGAAATISGSPEDGGRVAAGRV